MELAVLILYDLISDELHIKLDHYRSGSLSKNESNVIDVLPRNENTRGLGSSGVNSQTTLEHSVPNILKKCQHILFLDNEGSVLTSSADCEGESLVQRHRTQQK